MNIFCMFYRYINQSQHICMKKFLSQRMPPFFCLEMLKLSCYKAQTSYSSVIHFSFLNGHITQAMLRLENHKRKDIGPLTEASRVLTEFAKYSLLNEIQTYICSPLGCIVLMSRKWFHF